MSTTAALTFTDVSKKARPYPSYLLPSEGTTLALFAAAFHGWNDSIHFARAGLRGDCVDVDERKLLEMQAIYPDDWEFHVADAWEFAEHHAGVESWDVVSVDPFRGDAGERAWTDLYLWCSLARSLVTLMVGSDTHLNVPEGWTGSFFPRTSSVAWLVMQRA